MSLWKIIDFDTGGDRLFCCRQCAENWMCNHDLPEDDLHELDPDNDEDDKVLIEECTPSPCDQCQRRIPAPANEDDE